MAEQPVAIDALDVAQEKEQMRELVEGLLQQAKQKGATGVEVAVSKVVGLTAQVRLGDVETIEFNRDNGFGIHVYFGQRKGVATTTDTRPEALAQAVDAACNIARYTSEDPCTGLADADLMAKDLPDLQLDHPSGMTAEQAIEKALNCERAGREADSRIINSDGASYSCHRSVRVYGNSHGFMADVSTSRHSMHATLIAQDEHGMQRDYWYTVSRSAELMEDAASVGKTAAQRTLRRLGARDIKTAKVPVIMVPEIATSLLGHFVAAVSGGNLYRKSSFLLDAVGEQIFPEFVRIDERPLLPCGLASAAFDNEGVATRTRDLVAEGKLLDYILSSYSARKLGLQTTGNAGGIHNLFINDTGHTFDELVKTMGTGLIVTELMGQGVNLVSGDYSRGASGFWVENGEIQHFVQEITIAGNLKDMFAGIQAIATDQDPRSSIITGSVLLSPMMVASRS